MANPTLFTWGPIIFQVWPFNVHEMQHTTETDWARKEIAGAAIHHEWVGENDEEIHLRGRVFPRFFGAASRLRNARRNAPSSVSTGPVANEPASGLSHLDVMDNMRRLAQVHVLVRGDSWNFGWFAISRLTRGHEHFDRFGIGQQINFEATFIRFPVPNDPSGYFPRIWGTLG